jgi:hypothetical protein
MDESRRDDIPQVSVEDNENAIFQMKHNNAPGSDVFTAEFYQAFWEIIKHDLMALFKECHNGTLKHFSLNFGIITLLPKQKEATHIKKFRPICLLNVSFNIVTKVAVNRITTITEELISPSQTASMPGRNIMEGVIILHEKIHELHRKKRMMSY